MVERQVVRQELVRARMQRRFARHGRTGDFLAEELAGRLVQRLDVMRLAPSRVLDLGCGVGRDVAMLRVRWPQAVVCGVDFVWPLVRAAAEAGGKTGWRRWLPGRERGAVWCAGDAVRLPFAAGSFDLVWANGLLQWLDEPARALGEIRRVLAPGGVCLFATLGPDSLRELRALVPERVHSFLDMHDLGDAMVRAGLQAPVMEMEMLTLRYARAQDVWRDLRAGGAGNARADAQRGLGGRAALRAAEAGLQARAEADGRFAVSVEIVIGHAWRAEQEEVAHGASAEGPQVVQFFPRRGE